MTPTRPDRLAHFTVVSAVGDHRAPTSVPAHVLDQVFITDEFALSFVATVARWGGPQADRIYSAPRLDEWLGLVGLHTLRSPASPAQLGLLSELRHAVYALVMARLDNQAPPLEAVALVNECAEVPDVPPRLSVDDFTPDDTRGPTAVELGSVLARSAINAVAGPWSHRLRRCDRSPCTHLFLDRTPRGLRRWCTSESCGNIARGRRHRARQASQVSTVASP